MSVVCGGPVQASWRTLLCARLRLLAALATCVAAAPAAADDYRLLEIDGLRMKWGAPDLGSGAAVTYGFATETARFPDAVNCRALAPIELIEGAWGGRPERLAAVAAEAFAMWSKAANLRFRPAAVGEAPDILIGVQAEPRRIAFANVWHATMAARDGVAPLTRATICFNPHRAWSIDVSTPPGAIDLTSVLAHEIGHAIGLDHPGATGALMGYEVRNGLDALLPGDIAGAVALYGRPGDAEAPAD